MLYSPFCSEKGKLSVNKLCFKRSTMRCWEFRSSEPTKLPAAYELVIHFTV